MARCDSEPLPIELKLYLPGFFFSSASSSVTLLTLSSGLTTSTLGCVTSCVMGAISLCGSYGRFENRSVLIASGPPMLMPRVAPLGAAFATTSAARLPPAPGLFSTKNVVSGYFFIRPSAMSRATMSGVDPGPNGTRMRTVLAGHSCARPGMLAAQSNACEMVMSLSREIRRAAAIADILCRGVGCIGSYDTLLGPL